MHFITKGNLDSSSGYDMPFFVVSFGWQR